MAQHILNTATIALCRTAVNDIARARFPELQRLFIRPRAAAENPLRIGEVRMIERMSGFADNILAFRPTGTVRRSDYDNVVIPAVEDGLRRHDKLRIYFEIGPDFDGIEPAAMWADFKVAFGHIARWDRIAMVTDTGWIRTIVTALSFIMPGEVKLFATADAAAARRWISG